MAENFSILVKEEEIIERYEIFFQGLEDFCKVERTRKSKNSNRKKIKSKIERTERQVKREIRSRRKSKTGIASGL